MFPEWTKVGASSFGCVCVCVIVYLAIFVWLHIVVELDLCVQSGGDVYSRAFLYSSHGTHRFPYGARCSRSNNQRTGEETPAQELPTCVFRMYTHKQLFAYYLPSPSSHTQTQIQTFTPGAAWLMATAFLWNSWRISTSEPLCVTDTPAVLTVEQ